jgi:sphingomyelin phosphodiesterase
MPFRVASMFMIPFLVTASTVASYSTDNSNSSLPLRGGPDLVYAGNYGVPSVNASSPLPEPLTFTATQIGAFAQEQIDGIIASTAFEGNCSKCIASLEVVKFLALSQPAQVPALLQNICKKYKFTDNTTCELRYSSSVLGIYLAQIAARLSVSTDDMQTVCALQFGFCPVPKAVAIDENKWFKPKPASANIAPVDSGKTIRVVHLSDVHLDSRYMVGSEGNCTDYTMCCRIDSVNSASSAPLVPAARYGNYQCDVPADLMLSMFDYMQPFIKNASFAIFTGDIASHDKAWQLSRAYQQYEEYQTLNTFKAQFGGIPLYPALGNHDSFPSDQNTPFWWAQNGAVDEFQWEYDFYSGLWAENGWISNATSAQARTHYGAYSTVTSQGLKIITINTDYWYKGNFFNYVNMTNPDSSGMLQFLIDELQAAEDFGQRVWIIGHVPAGYDGSNPIIKPPNLFYSIVQRYSPATIANVFFGHNHRDQFSLYYSYPSTKNGTTFTPGAYNTSTPLMTAWHAQSVTTLGGLNGGWRYYDVDAKTFTVYDSHNFYANISLAVNDDPVQWQPLYSARATYDPNGTWLGPLNATFWDQLTRKFATDPVLLDLYNLYETRASPSTPNCTSAACQQQKICYMRSGSTVQGMACGNKAGPN